MNALINGTNARSSGLVEPILLLGMNALISGTNTQSSDLAKPALWHSMNALISGTNTRSSGLAKPVFELIIFCITDKYKNKTSPSIGELGKGGDDKKKF